MTKREQHPENGKSTLVRRKVEAAIKKYPTAVPMILMMLEVARLELIEPAVLLADE